MRRFTPFFIQTLAWAGCALALLSHSAVAQVNVSEAWVRATVAQQKSTGAFFKITAATPVRLVGVTSPLAATVELHETKMQGNVMQMRAIAGLDLPAGTPVELKPGSYHLMLLNLRQPLIEGETVPLVLSLERAGQPPETVTVNAKVRALNTAAAHNATH
jgi:copper(I)-binding protein